MSTHTVYKAHERPGCEVQLEEGRWVYGQVRMWTRYDDGTGPRTCSINPLAERIG